MAENNDALRSYFQDGDRWEQEIVKKAKRSKAFAWLITLIFGGITILSLSALVMLVPLKSFEPYIVEVDKPGTSVTAGSPQQIEYADARVVRATLGNFITSLKSITPDAVVQKQYIDRTYALLRTSDPSTQKINAWFRGNSPFEKAKTSTVAIEVNNIVALSNQTYQIDWTEYERDRKGKETGTRRFRGIATVALTAPQDEAIIRLNPIGLYVQDFDWTAQL